MTDNTIRTVLEIGGEQSYKKSLTEINSALKGLDSEMAVLNAQYGKNASGMTALIGRQTQLSSRLDVQKKKLELVRAEYERVAKEQGANSEAARKLQCEFNYASAQFERTARSLEEVSEQVKKGGSRFEQFKKQLSELGVTAETFGKKMESVGNKMTAAGLAAAGTVLTASVKGWMELEDEMANVSTIADTSKKSLSELTQEIISASDATGVAAKELAQAQYQAISANVDTTDSALLVEKAAKAAKAGVADVTTVIDGATSILNAWKISASQSESVFDKLLKTQQRGKTTIGELASGIGQVTGLAPQLNMSLDETLAAVGALTQSGVGTSEAFNGLKAVMSGVLKPTAEARQEAKRLGLEFDSAALKTKGFTAFLADVMAKTGGSEESLAKLFGSVEGLSQVMLLGGSSAALYADILGDLTNSAGTLDRMFDVRTSSSAERFSMALNKVSNASIRLGESLAPYIDMAGDLVEGIADGISRMDAEQGKNIITSALWVAGIGKTISIAGSLAQNIGNISKAFKVLMPLIQSAGAVAPWLAAVGLAVSWAQGIRSEIKGKFLFDFDASELEQYRIDAQTLENPIEVNAKAQLKIQTDLNGIRAELVRWLSDGVPETPEEQAAMAEKVNTAIDGAFSAIKDHFEAKKAELDTQLAAGIITKETYDASLVQLNTQATSFETDLTAKADALHSYVATLVAANKTITEEEIAHLNELLTALGETASAVLEANNAAAQVYEASYRKVALGIGTEEDQRMAAEYIELTHDSDRRALEGAQTSVRERYAALMNGVSDAEFEALAQQEQTELDALAAQIEELNERRLAQYGELLEGIARQEGVDLHGAMASAAREHVAFPGREAANKVAMQSILKSFYGFTEAPFEQTVGYLTANSEGQTDSITAITQALEALQAQGDAMIAEGGGVAALDAVAQSLEDVNQAAAENEAVQNLPEEYAEIGAYTVESLVNAVEGELGDVYGAGLRIGWELERGAKAGLGICSPSKKAQEIAANFSDTLAGDLVKGVSKVRSAGELLSAATVSPDIWKEKGFTGVGSQIAQLRTAYAQMTSPRMSASAGAAAGNVQNVSAAGGRTIINNINYTAGAGTRRQARRLNQMLAAEQKAALAAEGL